MIMYFFNLFHFFLLLLIAIMKYCTPLKIPQLIVIFNSFSNKTQLFNIESIFIKIALNSKYEILNIYIAA